MVSRPKSVNPGRVISAGFTGLILNNSLSLGLTLPHGAGEKIYLDIFLFCPRLSYDRGIFYIREFLYECIVGRKS